MDDNPQQHQIKNLIEFAFAQRKFKKVIQLTDNYLSLYKQSKQIYWKRAVAHTQLGKCKQCLEDLQNATRLGMSLREISPLRIRSYLQLGQIKQAQASIKRVSNEDQEIRKYLQLKNAIDLLKDDFASHKLPQVQQKIGNRMKNWLQKAGATFPKLKLCYIYPGYRGAIATQHIKKRQPIVFIPKSQLISLQMAKNCKLIQPLIQKKVKLQSPKHTYLSLLLLQLKSTPNSKYQPYIDLLPTDHSCFPINYTTSQLQLLEGSPFLNMIYQKAIDLKRDYQLIIKADPNLQKFTFKQFCWARMMIGSRIFGLTISGIKTQVLVPFADMLNHRQPKQTVWNYQQSVNGFVIESLEDIEIGQEVFDSYGRKCNSRFLLNYGFVLEDNPDNQISFKLVIGDHDHLSKFKREMINQPVNEAYVQVKKISLNLNNNKFYELMGCIRFICVDQQQTLNMLKKISNITITKQPYSMIRTPPISIKNELSSWQKFHQLCSQNLQKYPKPEVPCPPCPRSANMHNIHTLIQGQLCILEQYTKICKQIIKILENENIIEALEQNKGKVYVRYMYKILSLMPGINKKMLEKKFVGCFGDQGVVEDLEEVPEN